MLLRQLGQIILGGIQKKQAPYMPPPNVGAFIRAVYKLYAVYLTIA